MQQDNLILGERFSAIPLLLVNFANRFTVLANLIHRLDNGPIRESSLQYNDEQSLLHMSRLRNRLQLIGIIQYCAAVCLVLALTSMIAAYFFGPDISGMTFLSSIMLMIISMPLFTHENRIAKGMLDNDLSGVQTRKKWQRYLKPKNKQRNKSRQAASNKTG